jgi:IS5 family transposase
MLHIAEKEGLELRQSYRLLMERAFRKHGGHSKAKPRRDSLRSQFKRARKALKSLKTMAGRVVRDVERKMSDEAFEAHRGTMLLSELILSQNRKT